MDNMVIFSMISVHEDYGGRGIGSQLAQKSEEFLRAQRPDVKLISCETTGAGSAKIFQRQGFQKLSEVVYETYQNSQHETVFLGIPEPHRACIVWAKLI